MSFLAPLFLAGAAAAAIPIVLHLLKREPEPRVKFAAVKLLKQAPVEHTQKRHVRQLLLLALRIGAIVLLALAFARPFFATGAGASSGSTIVALDTSYSMSSPGRFERARQLARDAIANAPASDLIGVVTFADVAEVLAKPSADRLLATAAIDRAAPGFGATKYRAALSAAASLLGGAGGTIVVVTDLQESGWDTGEKAAVPESARIETADVGGLPADLAVIGIRPAGDHVIATVRNSGGSPRDARVRVSADDRPAGESAIAVGPNAVAEVELPAPPRATSMSVAVDDPDGLQANNVRYAVLGGANLASVLLVSTSGDLEREAYYVRAALEAMAPDAESLIAVGVGGAQLASWSDQQLAAHAAVVLLSTRGLERRGRELLKNYARAGGGLLIVAGPDVDGDVIAGAFGTEAPLQISAIDAVKSDRRTLAPADVRHPIFQRFGPSAATLGLVAFRQIARVAGGGCQPLARFTTGETALADCAAGEGRLLVFASDLDNRWNDFPLHATFVPFLHEAVRYLAGAQAGFGDYIVGDIPGADGARPGIITVQTANRQTAAARRVAVNVDPQESDPARISAADFQSAVARLKDEGVSEARVEARQQEDRQHLWQYLLATMLGLLVAESAIASRTA